MRFKKRPKIVEAAQVKDILSGDAWPHWLQKAASAGKIHIEKERVSIVIGEKIKAGRPDDWIVYDTEQRMVYHVSSRVMDMDYEPLKDDQKSIVGGIIYASEFWNGSLKDAEELASQLLSLPMRSATLGVFAV